jgi:hypothetical protein
MLLAVQRGACGGRRSGPTTQQQGPGEARQGTRAISTSFQAPAASWRATRSSWSCRRRRRRSRAARSAGAPGRGQRTWWWGCHYYPPCPEPHLIYMLGHPTSFLTVLLQGGVGGLQVLVGACLGGALGGRRTPVPGALVVNVGDLLQPPARVQTTGSRAWSTGWWPVATSPTVSLCWSRRPAFSGRPAPPRPPGNPVVLDECILPICHDKGYPLDQR